MFHRPLNTSFAPDEADCTETLSWTVDPDRRHSGWPLRATASLALPVDAEELFFVSHGPRSGGLFDVVQSGDAGDEAFVEVEVLYRHPNVLGDATVCRLERGESRHGLGIFTHWLEPIFEHQLHFHVTVHLPASGPGQPLKINALNTNLPQFSHHLAQLADTVLFRSIHLRSTNAGLRVDSLAADAAVFQTLNGKILGTFNTTSSLDIETRNGPIEVHANLYNKDEVAGTRLALSTSNGPIHASVGLFSGDFSRIQAAGGAFGATAMSTNGPVAVVFTEAPVNSLLNASAVSSNSPVRVLAHPTFEGTFELHSAWFSPPGIEQHDVEDPLGNGRRRALQVNTIRRGAVRGKVEWTPKHADAKNGHVNVETSNAKATLTL
ncbi:hypothetical protein C8Q78DRAFT_976847 [Trametes maxima]|nr:hypothetical protein C8Q78DRAFT_976847 [Trametes maxima]